MQLQPADLKYVPTLALRPHEIKGLGKLPGPTKDRLQPLFLLAPWPNSGSLEASMTKLAEAFPNRPYALDLDRDYENVSDGPAIQQFQSLFDTSDAFGKWRELVAMHPNLSPVLQIHGTSQRSIVRQISDYQSMSRTFLLRLERARMPLNLHEIVEALNMIGSSDFFIVLEGGWSHDVLAIESWFDDLLGSDEIRSIKPTVPIVLSATSMPYDYSKIEGVKHESFTNRDLLRRLTRKHNWASLVYGDWGSTRPRKYDRGSTPLPRIDYPTKDGWTFARSKTLSWSYSSAAKQIINEAEWKKNYPMGLWGEEMINNAAKSDGLGVSSFQSNIAARVNIHLHVQAFYDTGDIRGLNLDEPWTDI